MQLVPGGTANLAVLGGNLPPSSEERAATPDREPILKRPGRAGSPSTQAGGPLGLRQEYFVVFLNVQSKYILL